MSLSKLSFGFFEDDANNYEPKQVYLDPSTCVNSKKEKGVVVRAKKFYRKDASLNLNKGVLFITIS